VLLVVGTSLLTLTTTPVQLTEGSSGSCDRLRSCVFRPAKWR
jgi:hypothetical protein